ncbi:MAG: AAA family ATPase [Magnetococcales bacterium]|nr:AAA family ATPase [Magnetococcales bacterium]
MRVYEIKPAVRTERPARIAIWGPSYSGKTHSALRLARGLVGPHGKIGFIDTENRRALDYAGIVGGKFEHIDLQPPFTPENYLGAFQAFENAGGYNCIIIDSASHVWEGEGGVLDQAESSTEKGLSKWKRPKTDHKRMMNIILRSPMHVIFLLRAKSGIKQKSGGTPYDSGLEPVTDNRNNIIYEMTVSILLGHDHKPMFQDKPDCWCNSNIPKIKAPQEILHAIKPGEFLSEATGEAIRQWAAGVQRDVGDEAKRVAARGTEAFRGWWKTITQTDRASLQSHIPELSAISKAADEKAAQEQLEQEAPQAQPEQELPFQPSGQPDVVQTEQPVATSTPAPEVTAAPTPTPEPKKEESGMTADEFRKLCREHDWTWEHSDDARAFRAGKANHARLDAMAKGNAEFIQIMKEESERAMPKVQPTAKRISPDENPF